MPELEQTKSLEKKYKKVMDRCIRIHRKKMRQKIHNLRSINTKEYWKIINSGRKQISPNISINVLGQLRFTLEMKVLTNIYTKTNIYNVRVIMQH